MTGGTLHTLFYRREADGRQNCRSPPFQVDKESQGRYGFSLQEAFVNKPHKHIVISTLPPHPDIPYSMFDAIMALNEKGDVYQAFEQLRAEAYKMGADAVVGVQVSISTFFGATQWNTKQRVVLIGTPIKFLPRSAPSAIAPPP
jgi:hypothetical protein